jgi:multiple sugar transport system substrate-binding protein
MPPAATTWTWDGEGQSVAQGQAAMLISWCEFFPSFDGKGSQVVGKMEAARPPIAKKLRPPADAGFGEIPNVGHQGGSAIALSKFSKNKDAAWIFMQWPCSPDVMARVSTLGGGASPVRISSFEDPRVKAIAKVGTGTTRHFDAIKWTIDNAMGSEPDMPAWAEISNNVVPIRTRQALGRPVPLRQGVHGRDQTPGRRYDEAVPDLTDSAPPYRGTRGRARPRRNPDGDVHADRS